MITLENYFTHAAAQPMAQIPHEIRAAYRVGGISFGLVGGADMSVMLDPELRRFATDSDSCDVQIRVEWGEDLRVPPGTPLFDSGGLWSLYEEFGGYHFYFSTPSLGDKPYKAAWFDREFRRGHVALYRPYFDTARPIYPMEYPLDELVMIHRLAMGEGVEVHGCGVIAPDGRGMLLTGHSGAGKSTSARLWSNHSAARVLSDDRIILRQENGRIQMYGTPWHGDAGIAEAAQSPVDAIFVLQHGKANELRPLGVAEGAAELFARSFVPHHSHEGLSSALKFFHAVTSSVPCFGFSFVPDFTAVEAVCRA
jgi:hypothetical protein